MSTPYVTPQMMIDAPLGISWSTIPTAGASEVAKLAAQVDIANRASALVDQYCNQPLRSTVDVEQVFGPDSRLTVEPNGVGHALLSRWPITKVISGRVSASTSFPRTWTTIPSIGFELDQTLMPLAGSTVAGADGQGASGIYIAPGYFGWRMGRRGFVLEVTYVNGWPHAGTTTATAAGVTSLAVDDVTGFTGAIAKLYDGANTEVVTVLSTSGTSGPGTLTLSGATTFTHNSGVLISTLPETVQLGALFYCAHIALERGATALTVPGIPGSEEHGHSPDYAAEAEILLHPYKRVI